MAKQEIRGPFARPVCDTEFKEPSMTQQSFKDECDINVIMAKHRRGQLIDHVNQYQGEYADYTDVPQSYHEALNQVTEAQAMFMTLPAELRDQFNNDPGAFLEFVDQADREQLDELGLTEPGRASEPLPPEGNKRPVSKEDAPQRGAPKRTGRTESEPEGEPSQEGS